MSTEPYMSSIIMYPYNFTPRGYSFCGGNLLPISQFSALFSLIGTMYGGNGQTNFALPNLMGRAPIGEGHGPGLSTYVNGEMIGSAEVTLTPSEVPAHNHQFLGLVETNFSNTVNAQSTLNRATDGSGTIMMYSTTGTPNTELHSLSVNPVGGQPHNNRQPLLAINFYMAIYGIYPSRN